MDCHFANVPFSVFPGGPFTKNATQAVWLAENANVRTRGIDVAAELLESVPDPVIGCDTGGTIVYRQTSWDPAHVPGPTPQLLSWDSPLADADVPGLRPDAPGRIDRKANRVSGAA
jgi:hypothetical protein